MKRKEATGKCQPSEFNFVIKFTVTCHVSSSGQVCYGIHSSSGCNNSTRLCTTMICARRPPEDLESFSTAADGRSGKIPSKVRQKPLLPRETMDHRP